MKFKALSSIVIFDGQMNVFNPGDSGDLPDALIQPYIDGGKAEPVKAKKGKAKAEPEQAEDDDGLTEDAAALAEMTGAPAGDDGAAPIA